MKREPSAPKHEPWTVYYRIASDPLESCGTCRYFRKRADYDNGTCEIVKGVIEPEATCNLWEAPATIAEAGSLPLLGIAGALLIFGIMSSKR